MIRSNGILTHSITKNSKMNHSFIVVIFGQPCSGKSTLTQICYGYMSMYKKALWIDGDAFRREHQNNDYSRNGRINNIKKACDLAVNGLNKHDCVFLSFVFPYKEMRDYLNSLYPNIVWVFLTYDAGQHERGRESFHVQDFEYPDESEIKNHNITVINTGENNISDSINIITNKINIF